jgi:hypothetical protein
MCVAGLCYDCKACTAKSVHQRDVNNLQHEEETAASVLLVSLS